jgi:hypothetical protein
VITTNAELPLVLVPALDDPEAPAVPALAPDAPPPPPLDPLDPALELPALELPPPELEDDPPPPEPTTSPAWPPTEVTVPDTGARSTVWSTAF